ncbi:unnamed protein product [Caenorhabditis bovis]|uniref:Uncharacterized protein n=1 Tax=Caenorhabditis bovis TaxID=2654633 RepID=A0A8S1EYP6_9PELO|nr:unnamed protein product [Caenorhabditis bovis]
MNDSSQLSANYEEGISDYWFAIIELIYVAVFAGSAYLVRASNLMKTDDDAVTSHHKFHDLRIRKQEEELIATQKTQLHPIDISENVADWDADFAAHIRIELDR